MVQLHPALQDVPADEETLRALHRTIADVTEMTETMRFNTAISQMMVFVNEMTPREQRSRAALEDFLRLLAPYAPHLAEEIWERLGHEGSIARVAWPTHDPKYLSVDMVTVVVQVNGKVRDRHDVPADASEDAVKALALASERLAPQLEGKRVVKAIYVPGKLLNLVVK